jgi:hypothetical protein
VEITFTFGCCRRRLIITRNWLFAVEEKPIPTRLVCNDLGEKKTTRREGEFFAGSAWGDIFVEILRRVWIENSVKSS